MLTCAAGGLLSFAVDNKLVCVRISVQRLEVKITAFKNHAGPGNIVISLDIQLQTKKAVFYFLFFKETI